MGTREFVKFLLFITGFIGLSAFVTMLFVYYATRDEKMLYKKFNGFQGVVAGMLVGVKQVLPDSDVALRAIKIKCRHLPALHLTAMFAAAAATHQYLALFGFTFFGGFGGWLYVRYYQPRPDGTGVGDSGDHISFVSFFPGFMAPLLSPLADAVHACCCGRRERRLHTRFSAMTGGGGGSGGLGGGGGGGGGGGRGTQSKGVTTPDSEEAQRRRERGAKALAERLAEKQKKAAAAAAAASGGSDDAV